MIRILFSWILLIALLGTLMLLNMRSLNFHGSLLRQQNQRRWNVVFLILDIWIVGYAIGIWLITILYAGLSSFVFPVSGPGSGMIVFKYLLYIFYYQIKKPRPLGVVIEKIF